MLKTTAFKYASGYKIAKLLGVSRQYVYAWPDVVPFRCAVKLERISDGKVKVKKSLYENGAEK